MRRIEKDNRGFSLVELIIVIAIMVALTTTAILSFNIVFNANAKTCANDIQGAIAECKVKTMSYGQGNVRLVLYKGSDGSIYSELQTRKDTGSAWTAEKGAEKIGASRCSVSDEAGNELPEGSSSGWLICFNRSSGSFTDDTSIDEIHVQGGSKHYRIKFEKLTGKYTVDLL